MQVQKDSRIIPPLRSRNQQATIDFLFRFSCLDSEGHLWSFGSYDPAGKG